MLIALFWLEIGRCRGHNWLNGNQAIWFKEYLNVVNRHITPFSSVSIFEVNTTPIKWLQLKVPRLKKNAAASKRGNMMDYYQIRFSNQGWGRHFYRCAGNKGNYLFPWFNEIYSHALSRLLSTNGISKTPKPDQGRQFGISQLHQSKSVIPI